MPKLMIDNHPIEVPDGTKVIDAAARLGIVIPRFCFHPALGAVGACRVCAVAFVDGPVKGIQMSCMVDALDGMVVSTTDPKAVDFRRHVIEWLMLNHPHDCPVCDEGGHCLLQDTTVAGGHGMRRYRGAKRTHRDQYLGPLVQHEMNRCIQCYRCSRYYQQYSGYRDLGVMGIGTRVYFGRSAPGRLESPFAGNLIDICPTGVYTDKPSRYFGRRWDFERAPSVCIHCSLGCNVTVSARYRQVVRHEARVNADVNGYFICDRGRFAYPYANAPDRPRQARVDGESGTVPDAIAAAVSRLDQAVARGGSRGVAVIGSARSSLETLAALDALCRHRAWAGPIFHTDKRTADAQCTAVRHVSADTAVSLAALGDADAVVVIGADLLNEAPMAALSIRHAQRGGARISVIDPRPVSLPSAFDHIPVPAADLERAVWRLAEAVDPKATGGAGGKRLNLPWEAAVDALAGALCRSHRTVVICGTAIATAGEVAATVQLTQSIGAAGARVGFFPILDGPNAFAAARLMARPTSIAQAIDAVESGQTKAWVVVENDLWGNFPDRARLVRALDRLDLLVVLDYAATPLAERADVFLPTQTVYEALGHWLNPEGRLQQSRPVLAGGIPIAVTGRRNHPPRTFEHRIPGAEPTAAWALITALAGDAAGAGPDSLMKTAMDHMGVVRESAVIGQRVLSTPEPPAAPFRNPIAGDAGSFPSNALVLLVVDQVFGTESLSASAPALAELTPPPTAAMHPITAQRLGLMDGAMCAVTTDMGQIRLTVVCHDGMALDAIVVPRYHHLNWQVLDNTRMVLEPGQIVAVNDPLAGYHS